MIVVFSRKHAQYKYICENKAEEHLIWSKVIEKMNILSAIALQIRVDYWGSLTWWLGLRVTVQSLWYSNVFLRKSVAYWRLYLKYLRVDCLRHLAISVWCSKVWVILDKMMDCKIQMHRLFDLKSLSLHLTTNFGLCNWQDCKVLLENLAFTLPSSILDKLITSSLLLNS